MRLVDGAVRRIRNVELAALGLLLLCLMAFAPPATARILKTRVRAPGEMRFLELTIGSGVEFETDAEQTEWGLPFLLEYGVTPALTLTVEPMVTSIRPSMGRSLTGFGDLETSVSYALVSERRHRPAIAAIGLVKWPTAAFSEFGTGYRDYDVGALLSKALVQADLDLEVTYTFTGHAPGQSAQNSFTVALAAERDLTDRIDLLAELVNGGGGSFGASTPSGSEAEGTLGLAEQLTERLKIEQGVVVKSDGTWQLLFGWEWEFGDVR